MRIALKALLAVTIAYALAFGQSGDFLTKGSVVSGGQPLNGATVSYTSLAKRLSWDITGSAGTFGPRSTQAIHRKSVIPGIIIDASGPVYLDVFDPSGRKIASFVRTLDAGRYSFEPASLTLPQTMYVLRITVGGAVTYRTIVNAGNRHIVSYVNGEHAPGTLPALMKKCAAVDTVRVGKTGYVSVKVPVTAYSDDIGPVTLSADNIEAKVSTLLGQMSQAEKVGQLVQVVFPGTSYVGSALLGTVFGGGGDGPGNGAGNPSQWASFCNDYQNATSSTGRKIPLLVGLDVVHGFGKCNGATVIPHNIGLGCTFDPAIVQKSYRVAGIESRACGLNFAFGPCIAVPRNDKWGRVYEGFSESPDLTVAMARASVLGFQTSDLSLPTAVAACAKHFAGDGGTDNGVNAGNMTGNDAQLRAIHLAGYTSAVQAGVASVMASYSQWNGVRMHENKTLLTDWLKTSQGFDGFVNGDWSGDLQGTQGTAACVIAGLDVPMRGDNSPGIPGLQASFNSLYGNGNGARVDDAVKRLLRIKYRMNLFSSPLTANPALTALVGSQAHRDVAREAVRKSLVLLKTSAGLLPIAKTAKVTLVGQHSQDIGLQCGGWTLGWQGAAGNAMPGTTIRQGFERIGGGGNISYSADGNSISGDVAVVCIGEQPYAETMGDRTDLTIPLANLVTNAKNSGKKVVCVLITGRPMDISAIVDKCDAIVAAWLPGTEGDGVAEVLYGTYEFKGKLSISWPRSTSQEPVNVGDAGYNPLYPYGFGLNAAGQNLPTGMYQ